MSKFKELPKDVIVLIALSMDIPEILSLCITSKKFNINVCKNKIFWISKLNKDFNNIYQRTKQYNINPKTFYFFLKNYMF